MFYLLQKACDVVLVSNARCTRQGQVVRPVDLVFHRCKGKQRLGFEICAKGKGRKRSRFDVASASTRAAELDSSRVP